MIKKDDRHLEKKFKIVHQQAKKTVFSKQCLFKEKKGGSAGS
jgi:hypothetical protein